MRLIDSDALERELGKNYVGLMFDDINKLEYLIDDAPTIDVEPVVRGKWIDICCEADGICVECDQCCNRTSYVENYCPNCGANMKGEESNG